MGEFRKFLEDELNGTTSKVGDDPGYRPAVIKKDNLEDDKTLNIKRKMKNLNFSRKSQMLEFKKWLNESAKISDYLKNLDVKACELPLPQGEGLPT